MIVSVIYYAMALPMHDFKKGEISCCDMMKSQNLLFPVYMKAVNTETPPHRLDHGLVARLFYFLCLALR